MASNADECIYDVIIIGAGISGLSSAYLLKKNKPNLRILVVEAKDRVGGRTQTVELNCSKPGKKANWDAGGQWVSNSQKNITNLLGELKLETYPQHIDGKKILEADKKIKVYSSSIPNISLLSLADLGLSIYQLNSNAKKCNAINPLENTREARNLDQTNLERFLLNRYHTKNTRAILDASVRTVFGLELSQINTLFALTTLKSSAGGTVQDLTLAEKDCAQEFRVKGGTQQISQRLLDFVSRNSNQKTPEEPGYFKIIYNAAVKEIQQDDEVSNGLVTLRVEDRLSNVPETFKARKIISSIPPNQYLKIKFTPDLPNYKLNVLKFSHMGNAIKVILTYKQTFWRDKGFSGEVVSDGSIIHINEKRLLAHYCHKLSSSCFDKRVPKIGPISIVYDGTNSDGEPALICFVMGDPAVEWLDLSPELRKVEIVESMVRYFGAEARDYVDYYEKNWNDEPFTGGCPVSNISSSGIMKDFARALREPFLNMHFCGTETATEWIGYMDGAVESAERVANEVLYVMFQNDGVTKVNFAKTYFAQQKEVIQASTANNKMTNKRSSRLIQSLSYLFHIILLFSILFYIFMRLMF